MESCVALVVLDVDVGSIVDELLDQVDLGMDDSVMDCSLAVSIRHVNWVLGKYEVFDCQLRLLQVDIGCSENNSNERVVIEVGIGSKHGDVLMLGGLLCQRVICSFDSIDS